MFKLFRKRTNPNNSRRPVVHKTAMLTDRKRVELAEGAHISEHVIVRACDNPLTVGRFSQIGPFCVILVGSPIRIGNHVMIGPHVVIASGNHDYKQVEKPMRFAGNLTKGPIVIEDNVWIGANVTITDGVRIGHDSVIGANSVVTKDVAPYDVVGGVPARVIGNRLEAAEKQAA